MNLTDRVTVRSDGDRHVGYLRNRLIAARRPELRHEYRNASEISSPIANRINDFVTGYYPHMVCDRCICEELDFYSSAQAAQITEALGTTSDFDRRHGQCVLCKNERIVIRANRTSKP
jgi:hypothetical protein